HLSAGERSSQPLASDGVDARRWRGRQHLVAALTKVQHDLFPDEAASTDDDDFHGCPPVARDVPNPNKFTCTARAGGNEFRRTEVRPVSGCMVNVLRSGRLGNPRREESRGGLSVW